MARCVFIVFLYDTASHKEPEEKGRAESPPLHNDGYSSDEDYSDDADEGREGYRPGGYHPINIGDRFNSGRYIVLEKLGWGHFSTVWMCLDKKSHAKDSGKSTSLDGVKASHCIALKVQKSDAHYREAAMDEIQLLQSASAAAVSEECAKEYGIAFDPSVVLLLDTFEHVGPHGRHVCMAFEMLGENLLSVIKKYDYRGIPIHIVQRITLQICQGLDFLHRFCSIIHTDLKPENILVSRPPELPAEEQIVEIVNAAQEKGNTKSGKSASKKKSSSSGKNEAAASSTVATAAASETAGNMSAEQKKKMKKKMKKRRQRAKKGEVSKRNSSGRAGGRRMKSDAGAGAAGGIRTGAGFSASAGGGETGDAIQVEEERRLMEEASEPYQIQHGGAEAKDFGNRDDDARTLAKKRSVDDDDGDYNDDFADAKIVQSRLTSVEVLPTWVRSSLFAYMNLTAFPVSLEEDSDVPNVSWAEAGAAGASAVDSSSALSRRFEAESVSMDDYCAPASDDVASICMVSYICVHLLHA